MTHKIACIGRAEAQLNQRPVLPREAKTGNGNGNRSGPGRKVPGEVNCADVATSISVTSTFTTKNRFSTQYISISATNPDDALMKFWHGW